MGQFSMKMCPQVDQFLMELNTDAIGNFEQTLL